MTLIQDLIYQHEIDEDKYDQTSLAKYSIKHLDHDHRDVRANGFITLLRQYQQMGDDLIPHIKSMKGVHKDIFM